MYVQTLNIYQIPKKVLGEEDAQSFITYIEASNETNISNHINLKLSNMVTKDEFQLFKEESIRTNVRLEHKISESKSELIKWVFIFILGQTAAMIAVKFLI